MQKGDIEAICAVLEKRASFLEQYDDISQRLLVDDIDEIEKFDKLLDVRQGFLLEFNRLKPELDKLLLDFPKEEQKILQRLLKYEGLEALKDDGFSKVRGILIKTRSLIASINEKTEKINQRLENYRNGLLESIAKLSQGQKVASFMESASNSDFLKGEKFDSKK